MKAYAIALIVCGSALAAILVLYCLYKVGCKKKDVQRPTIQNRSKNLPYSTYHDVESGPIWGSNDTKDSGTAFFAGAALATVITTPTAACLSNGGESGFSNGGGGGGEGGGGCGGGGSGGGCGESGGGCGGFGGN